MQTAINQFRVNIGRVRNLDAVYKTSIGQTTAIVPKSIDNYGHGTNSGQ